MFGRTGDSRNQSGRQNVTEQRLSRYPLRVYPYRGVGTGFAFSELPMLHPLVVAVSALPAHTATTPHDAGVRQAAVLSARLAYVLTCATLVWGVLVATGWLHRLTGRHAT